MTILEEIAELPDYIESNIILEYYDKLLLYQKDNHNVLDICKAMSELSQRYWHTYEIMPDPTKARIEKWTVEQIEFSSVEIVNEMLGIALSLGLDDTYKFIISKINDQSINSEVRKEIEKVINYYGDSAADPYKSMR